VFKNRAKRIDPRNGTRTASAEDGTKLTSLARWRRAACSAPLV